jgi:N-acylneuraminate cytidylyltransferase
MHALKELPGYDIVVLLQPTSPFRLSKDIDACIEACVFNNAKSSVSVCIPKKSPYWMFTQDEKGYYKPLMGWDYILHQRQQLKKILCPNGAVYVCYSDFLMSNGSFINESMACYEMPQERSIDIDDKFDMILAESILKEMNNRVLSGD